MRTRFGLAAWLLLFPACVTAGSNSGGVLLVHDANLTYTTDLSTYCGLGSLPDSCAAVDSEIEASGPDNPRVWKAYAAFPATNSPRLKGVAFGVHYSPNDLMILFHGLCVGDLNNGAAEFPGPQWPGNDTGTSIVFERTQTVPLVECYWFAGYQYTSNPASTSGVTVPARWISWPRPEGGWSCSRPGTELPSSGDLVNLEFVRRTIDGSRFAGGAVVCRAPHAYPLSQGFRALPVTALGR